MGDLRHKNVSMVAGAAFIRAHEQRHLSRLRAFAV